MSKYKSSARRRAELHQAHEAKLYIDWFSHLIERYPGLKVVLVCRASTRAQIENLSDQVESCQSMVGDAGATIIKTFQYVASGKDREIGILREAADYARKNDAVIVAESVDRLVRGKCYHPVDNYTDLPITEDYEDLVVWTRGVRLATILPPQEHWARIRGHQTKRGMQEKGVVGGRPRKAEPGYKKRRREKKLPDVLRLRSKGLSIRGIAKETGVAKTTVQDWVDGYA